MGAFAVLSGIGISAAIVDHHAGEREKAIRQAEATAAQRELKKSMDDLHRSSLEIERSGKETARIQSLNTQLQERLLHQGDDITEFARQSAGMPTKNDSYPLLSVASPSDKDAWPTLWVIGRYPLRNVSGNITTLAEFRARSKAATTDADPMRALMSNLRTFEFPIVTRLGSKIFPEPIEFAPGDSERGVVAVVLADNGSWIDTVRLQKISGRWVSAMRVAYYDSRGRLRTIHEQADPNYPKVNGQVQW
jgi:hypothetical protein